MDLQETVDILGALAKRSPGLACQENPRIRSTSQLTHSRAALASAFRVPSSIERHVAFVRQQDKLHSLGKITLAAYREKSGTEGPVSACNTQNWIVFAGQLQVGDDVRFARPQTGNLVGCLQIAKIGPHARRRLRVGE